MDNNMTFRIYRLASSGLCCTQIMLKMTLEEEEGKNSDLLRAFRGMCGGIDNRGKTCGILTAGIGIIGLYAANGNEGEVCREDFEVMMDEYVDWFENEFKSTDCRELMGTRDISNLGKRINYPEKCAYITQKSYVKLHAILAGHGYEFGDRD